MSASNSNSSNNRSWSSRSRASKSRIRSLAVRTRRNKSPKSRWQPCLTTPTRLTRATARCDENSSSTAMRVHLSVLSGWTNFQCLYSVNKAPPVKSRSVCLLTSDSRRIVFVRRWKCRHRSSRRFDHLKRSRNEVVLRRLHRCGMLYIVLLSNTLNTQP